MHSKFLRWLSFVGLVAFVALDAAAQAPAPAAPAAPATAGSQMAPGRIKATRVVGTVTVEDKVSKATRALTNNDEIAQGVIVHTAENSSVVLIFSSGASINLAHTSDLDIETFLQDPFANNYEPAKETDEPSHSETSIKLTRGELVGNVKKLRNAGQPGGSTFKIGTPVGAAGIRGTTFRIVYRPTGNGQAFNFTLTTVEGNVEVTLATGTITAPPVSVTQNTEVVINNVTVDTATNTISVTTATGTTVPVSAPPPATTATVADVQIVQAAAQQIAQAVATAVFTPPPPTNTNTQGSGTTNGTTTNDNSNQNNQNQNNQNQQGNQQNNNQNSNNQQNSSSGGTTTGPRNTPGAGTN